MANRWWDYVDRHTSGKTQKEMAAESGIDQTVLSRWKLGKNPPSPEKVIEFARGIGRSPVEALIEAGIMHAAEAAEPVVVETPIETITDDVLLHEVGRRMKGAHDVQLEDEAESGASSTAPHQKMKAAHPKATGGRQGEPGDLSADEAQRIETAARGAAAAAKTRRIKRAGESS